MKCLITGANGMMGSALCAILADKGYGVVATDINNPDMLKLNILDFKKTRSFVKKIKPDVVFHLAAATDMDMCQKNPEFTYLINAKATESIATACKEIEAEMVYISTGAVFNGKKKEPYIESDETDPLNVYGKTKLAGEHFVQEILHKYYIFRAGWIIGGFEKDKKFVGKIMKLLETERELKVVNDRFGSPTCVEDFSKNMIKVVEAKLYGLYHLVNKGGCSRHDMAAKIVDFLEREDVRIIPIKNNDYPSVTPRAKTEIMINYKLGEIGMDDMAGWEDALSNYLKKLKCGNFLNNVLVKNGVTQK